MKLSGGGERCRELPPPGGAVSRPRAGAHRTGTRPITAESTTTIATESPAETGIGRLRRRGRRRPTTRTSRSRCRRTRSTDSGDVLVVLERQRTDPGRDVGLEDAVGGLGHLIQRLHRGHHLTHHIREETDEETPKDGPFFLPWLKTPHVLEHLLRRPVAQRGAVQQSFPTFHPAHLKALQKKTLHSVKNIRSGTADEWPAESNSRGWH